MRSSGSGAGICTAFAAGMWLRRSGVPVVLTSAGRGVVAMGRSEGERPGSAEMRSDFPGNAEMRSDFPGNAEMRSGDRPGSAEMRSDFPGNAEMRSVRVGAGSGL